MKTVILLVGVPASGKSTLIANEVAGWPRETSYVVISSDDLIEQKAAAAGKTYDEIFSQVADQCMKTAKQQFRTALSANVDMIFVDKTNLTKKSRAQWIGPAKAAGYQVCATEFALPSTACQRNEWSKRLNRPGKSIPDFVLKNMFSSYEPCGEDEGFDMFMPINNWER